MYLIFFISSSITQPFIIPTRGCRTYKSLLEIWKLFTQSLVFFQGSVFVFSFSLLTRTFKTAISNLTEFYHSFAYNAKDLLIYSLHRKLTSKINESEEYFRLVLFLCSQRCYSYWACALTRHSCQYILKIVINLKRHSWIKKMHTVLF